MGADNYENLGFQVKIDGADSAVSRLDDIIDRLNKIKELEGKKSSKKSETTQNKEAKQAIDKKTESQKNEEKQAKSTTNALASYISKLTSIVVIARQVGHFFIDAVNESAKYVENLNLFAVAFGDAYQENLKWALDLADAYGLASNEVIRFAGTFRELSTSLGLVENTANQVSETVTKLGYDLSALFNTTVEQAMEKLQSGIFSGNVRPLRAFGIDISQNQIDNLFKTNQALAEMGVNARNLTQSDKVIARLVIALQSGTDSFGTMAREINNLQSQFRIFQGSLENFKLAFGDLVEEPISRVMVYVNGLIIAVTDIIRAFKPLQTTDDNNLIDGTAMSAEEASDALDNLNGKLADFDKFNVLGGQSSGNSQLAVTEALNKLLEEQVYLYENKLSTALGNIKNEAVEVAKAITDFLGFEQLEDGTIKLTDEAKEVYNIIKEIIKYVGILFAVDAVGKIVKLIQSIDLLKLATTDFNNLLYAGIIYAAITLIQAIEDGDYALAALSATMIAAGVIIKSLSVASNTQLLPSLLNVAKGLTAVQIATSAVVGVLGYLIGDMLLSNLSQEARNVVAPIMAVVGAITALTVALLAMQGTLTWGTGLPIILGAVGVAIAGVKSMIADANNIAGFADGGYTNANLIMTHENGKREWVGKAAGSSAIVNDTQMSDIMEVAVAKGVVLGNRALGSQSGGGEQVIHNHIYMDGVQVYEGVTRVAKQRGEKWSNY